MIDVEGIWYHRQTRYVNVSPQKKKKKRYVNVTISRKAPEDNFVQERSRKGWHDDE